MTSDGKSSAKAMATVFPKRCPNASANGRLLAYFAATIASQTRSRYIHSGITASKSKSWSRQDGQVVVGESSADTHPLRGMAQPRQTQRIIGSVIVSSRRQWLQKYSGCSGRSVDFPGDCSGEEPISGPSQNRQAGGNTTSASPEARNRGRDRHRIISESGGFFQKFKIFPFCANLLAARASIPSIITRMPTHQRITLFPLPPFSLGDGILG